MSFEWLNTDSKTFLSRGYLEEGKDALTRIREICDTAEKILNKKGFSNRFYEHMSKGWISLSSPIWSNFGNERGLPISCNGVYMDDTLESIIEKVAEVGMQTKQGAGTSAYLGSLRSRGTKISSGGVSFGTVHFMEMLETTTNIISQSNVRRGSCAVYIDIEHNDIMEFLNCREEGSHIHNLSLGVCITDAWMKDMIDGDKSKRKIWARVLKKRAESGYPYIFFTDTVNNNKPQVYKDKNLKIHASNLCSEIMLHSSPDESFVCNLASVNAVYYDDWKDSSLVEDMVYFLDAVMSEYIDKTSNIKFMESVNLFAKIQRALGIGTLGLHSAYQAKNIAFESLEAKLLNTSIHKTIWEQSQAASRKMAQEYGEPELLKGYGLRHVTTCAVAPTTSSSFILGQVSPSIEPLNSNYFTKELAKGKFTYKNPYLKEVLKSYKKDDASTWKSILENGGSVQHLDFLSEHEKNVFKTFGEISQLEIIIQAANRQKFIDQGQSLNLMIHPDVSVKDVNKLMITAWEMGIKTLYYQRSSSVLQELSRNINTCVSCEV